jgi:hypothetical protein
VGAVEQQLLPTEAATVRGDAPRLISRITYLASQLGSADFRPTNSQLEVMQLFEDRLAGLEREFERLRAQEVGTFNELLRQRKLPPVATASGTAAGLRQP